MCPIRSTTSTTQLCWMPTDTAWEVMRNILRVVEIAFGGAVENVQWMKGGSLDKVPARYQFTLVPGGNVVNEEVTGRSEHGRSLTYRTIGQALSLVDYVATYRVLPVTNDGRSFLGWSREFRVVEGADPGFIEGFMDLLAREVGAVKAHFAA
jgi:hypothetical protein